MGDIRWRLYPELGPGRYHTRDSNSVHMEASRSVPTEDLPEHIVSLRRDVSFLAFMTSRFL